MIGENYKNAAVRSVRIGTLIVAIALAIVVGTVARGPVAPAWVFLLLVLSAGIIGTAQQTLP